MGFDWENAEQVLEKLQEELHELAEAREQASQEEIEGEIGDMLFVLVNLARFVKVDPEQALRKSNAKFRRRFAHVERIAAERGKKFAESNIEEMEELWQEAKRVGMIEVRSLTAQSEFTGGGPASERDLGIRRDRAAAAAAVCGRDESRRAGLRRVRWRPEMIGFPACDSGRQAGRRIRICTAT